MKTPIDWLIESNQPAIRYRTLLDVLDRPSSDEEARRTFAQITKGMGCSRRITKSIERGAEFFLNRKLFREGVRIYPPWFRFHYPVHYYYDLLAGLEVLSSLGYGKDPRMKFALELLQKKKRADGRWVLAAVNPDIPRNLPETSYSSSPPSEPFPAIPFVLERVGKPSKSITLRAIKVLKNVEIAV